GNFVGDGIRQALMARAGYDQRDNSNVYNGMTLREYARMSLTERGIGVASYNPMQMVGLAFTHTSSDFGNILLDVSAKALLQGWGEAEETFTQWTKRGQLADFKTAHRVGLGGFPSLRQVREGAEYKYVTTSDRGEPIALATYGEIFSISRQAIINDDLNQLTDVPMKLGRAAKATVGDLVYAILTSNPKLSDDKALFHADHNNLSTGGISVSSLDAARQLMRKQKAPGTGEKGEKGRTLNIRPAFMLVPVAQETLASQTIKSASVKGADVNSGIINPIQNFAEIIAEARLDDASAKAWYLTSAQGTDTIEVAYLDG
ncbi:ClpP-like prohead protease/major capsid protein fusion protein, partial [Candidatus Symbiopectobacterium sp. NZEC135]|nr:Clp protease ClpP [Candidatus Symbiopectobacterium sp. NZEC135]